ncbi:MAG TPA: translation elongation factor 4, partial [Spirochaetia bacterium]|nr:translation elongation factor 4 [Spirochaetia bacterium]
MVPLSNIRNFCIIAHIDHGKSTLADRLIERSHIIADRQFKDQILDSMDIERERGITIKSQAVTMPYIASDGQEYQLNLVDTPGHVDFSYEVSRAIYSCEGAVLLIDATQGVEAQTLSNMYMAIEHDLEILPVINKIDLPGAELDWVKHQIDHDLGLDLDHVQLISAKKGTGIEELLEAIIKYIPAPKVSPDDRLKALIFDSRYDAYRGVIVYVRNFSGTMRPGQEIRFWSGGGVHTVEETGIFKIGMEPTEALRPGEVGYLIAGIKDITDVRVGDTITDNKRPCDGPLPGFKEVKPVVFSSIYPIDADEYEELHSAIDRLRLNDASLIYDKDSSVALGFGFRCGFLGLLHLEVVQERLEREFDLSIVLTSPSVRYRVLLKDTSVVMIDNPSEYPDTMSIESVEEPYITATVITPTEYVGNVITLCLEKRGQQRDMTYLDEKRVELVYTMPLAEVLFDYY